MTRWLEEFLIVVNASGRLRIALFAIPVVPSLIVLLGAFQRNSARDVPGSLLPLVASMSQSLFYFYLVVAIFTCFGCIRIAAKEYRRAHQRLFR